MHLNTLRDLYIEELRDLYSAEDQLIRALPEMEAAANADELKMAFRDHLKETREHKKRLDQLFGKIGLSPHGKTCVGMQGLIREGAEAMKHASDATVKDAALIAAAQRVEHYEMAGYGCVRTFAGELDDSWAKGILQDTLDEEGAADKKLTSIAEGGLFKTGINEQAIPDTRR